MTSLFSSIKNIFSTKSDNSAKIGLAQFRLNSDGEAERVTTEPISIRNKSVKLSDLMRRTNMY